MTNMFGKMVVCTLFALLVYSVSIRVASPASVMPGTNGVQQDAIHQAIPAAAKKKTKARKPPAEKGKKPGRKYNIGVD
jgi:hypothetical protein